MFFSINRSLLTILISAFLVSSFACGKNSGGTGTGAQTPTEAYQKLYAAVKAKDYPAIKSLLTRQTVAFADGQSKTSKQTFEQMIANGFTATTFSPVMPEIRDERIKDNMGAVEVWNSKESKWEDLPFINEDGWKLAIGDVFKNSYKKPGDGRAKIEADANPEANKPIVQNPPANTDLSPMNAKPNVPVNRTNTNTK